MAGERYVATATSSAKGQSGTCTTTLSEQQVYEREIMLTIRQILHAVKACKGVSSKEVPLFKAELEPLPSSDSSAGGRTPRRKQSSDEVTTAANNQSSTRSTDSDAGADIDPEAFVGAFFADDDWTSAQEEFLCSVSRASALLQEDLLVSPMICPPGPPPGLGYCDERPKGWHPCAEAEEISTDKYWQLLARLRRAPGGAVPLNELRAKAPAGLYHLMGDANTFRAWLRHRTGLVEVTGTPGEEWLVLTAPEKVIDDRRSLRRRHGQGEGKVVEPERSLKGRGFALDPKAAEYTPGVSFGGFNPDASEFVPNFLGSEGCYEAHDWGQDSQPLDEELVASVAADLLGEEEAAEHLHAMQYAAAGYFFPQAWKAAEDQPPSRKSKKAKQELRVLNGGSVCGDFTEA